MTDTRDKLNEAAYFLTQMKANVEHKDGFRFNLSAFISALRSTTLFMQTEYTHTPGFLAWYETKQAEMEQDSILKFFNQQRVLTIHKRPIAAKSQVHFYSPPIDTSKLIGEQPLTFLFTTSISESGKPGMQVFDIIDPGSAIAGEPSYEVNWQFDDLSETDYPKKLDVLTLCCEQFDKISSIVSECERLFII